MHSYFDDFSPRPTTSLHSKTSISYVPSRKSSSIKTWNVGLTNSLHSKTSVLYRFIIWNGLSTAKWSINGIYTILIIFLKFLFDITECSDHWNENNSKNESTLRYIKWNGIKSVLLHFSLEKLKCVFQENCRKYINWFLCRTIFLIFDFLDS